MAAIVRLLRGVHFLRRVGSPLLDDNLFVRFDKCIKVAFHDPLPDCDPGLPFVQRWRHSSWCRASVRHSLWITGHRGVPRSELSRGTIPTCDAMPTRHVVGGIYQLIDIDSFSARVVSAARLPRAGRKEPSACSIKSNTSVQRTWATSWPSSG